MAISLLAKISNLVGASKGILFNNKSRIGDLIIDGTHLENITYSNTITKQPVESGAYISDHIYINPLRVVMDCSIVDDPSNIVDGIREIGSLFQGNILTNIGNKFRGKGAKQTAAYEFIKDLANSKSIVTIVNKLDVLPNMAMESVSIPRTGQTGDRLYFSITLQQISFATVKRTSALNNKYNISGRTNLGKQTSRAPTIDESQSAGSALINIGRSVKSSPLNVFQFIGG